MHMVVPLYANDIAVVRVTTEIAISLVRCLR